MRACIRFAFDTSKAIAAMAYIADRTGTLDKIKLIKMVYLADCKSLLEEGCPITGDRQVAMPWGPVPSGCLNLIDGNLETDEPFEFLHVVDKKISPTSKAKMAAQSLTDEERRILDAIISEHGNTPTWTLVRFTEKLPEYLETYRPNTSTTIPYELILQHHGDERHFRHGRPVISVKMAACMVAPFKPEPDL